MTSNSAKPNNMPVIIGSLAALMIGSGLILAYKGYFRSGPRDNRQDATRFTDFAKKAEQTGWQSEAPTALAEQVKGRIDRDAVQYKDKRFADLKVRFQTLEQQHKQGKQSNTEYQSALLALSNTLENLEEELAPDTKTDTKGVGGVGGDGPPAKKGDRKRRPRENQN